MDMEQLIRFAKAYSGLGSSIQQQLDSVIDGDLSDLNENAVAEMSQKLKGYDDDLDEALNRALEAIKS